MPAEGIKHPTIKHRYTDFGSDRIQMVKFSVKYKDVFSMSYLYMLLHEWLVDYEYATRDDEEFQETFYLQRENPAAGREMWVRWRVNRVPELEKTALWRYDLDIDIHVLGLQQVEMLWKGSKVKMDKGEVEVSVVANLIVDYEKAWEKHPLWKAYKDFIINKFLKKKLTYHKRYLYEEAMEFREAIRSWLKPSVFLPQPEQPEFWARRRA